ncbi:hypothetical protein MNBD_GAMMA15-1900 [hydrothermal vent metagenome]|uniref:DUF5666 domain-containing protein n=1 Tax=hydrothermal vent metagenome TaxID=652676 RepID=A0A3B0YFW3_9ZZZZ
MRTLKTLIAILFIALPTLSYAADNEPRFEFAGTVDRIDVENDAIIIGDMLFRISPGLTIRDTRQNVVNLGKLQNGMKVGINTYSRGEPSNAPLYVNEVQIFRSNVNLRDIADN